MASASVTDSLPAVDAAIESLTELPASASEDEIRNAFARFAQAALTARGNVNVLPQSTSRFACWLWQPHGR